MKTLLALLLIAGPASAAELSRPEEAPAVRSTPVSPVLEPGSEAPLESGAAMDFPENIPQEGSGPMLDRKELKRRTLVPVAGVAGKTLDYDQTKKGFKPVSFGKGRVEIKGPNPRSDAMVAIAAVVAGIAKADPGKVTYVDTDKYRPDGQHMHFKVERPDGTVEDVYFDPLVFDLDGDGVRMSRRTARYDATGDRKTDTVSDISSGDGMLVLDSDHDGIVGEGGLEAFGNATDLNGDHKKDGYADGFEALLALCRKAQAEKVLGPKALDDRLLDAKELKKLAKAYGLSMKVGSVLKAPVSLEKAGVRSISLPEGEAKRTKDFDSQGNERSTRPGAVFTRLDGKTASYTDVWFEL